MRVKRGFVARRKRKKILKRAQGFRGSGSRLLITAKQLTDRALVYAYRDRKTKKRDFRGLWIQRINAAARMNGTSYSRLMGALQKSGVELDRKVLAEMAIHDPNGFSSLVKSVGAAH